MALGAEHRGRFVGAVVKIVLGQECPLSSARFGGEIAPRALRSAVDHVRRKRTWGLVTFSESIDGSGLALQVALGIGVLGEDQDAAVVPGGAALAEVGAELLAEPLCDPLGLGVRAMPSGVGDIELGPLTERASAYTPVPGGVGPMTINTLIYQTVEAGEKSLG